MNTLMERIKIKSFLNFSYGEQINFVETIQKLRLTEQEIARLNKGKITKSAKRNLKRRNKKVKDPVKEAIKLLQKLNPAQLSNIERMIE